MFFYSEFSLFCRLSVLNFKFVRTWFYEFFSLKKEIDREECVFKEWVSTRREAYKIVRKAIVLIWIIKNLFEESQMIENKVAIDQNSLRVILIIPHFMWQMIEIGHHSSIFFSIVGHWYFDPLQLFVAINRTFLIDCNFIFKCVLELFMK